MQFMVQNVSTRVTALDSFENCSQPCGIVFGTELQAVIMKQVLSLEESGARADVSGKRPKSGHERGAPSPN
jgi:hypothetical protein